MKKMFLENKEVTLTKGYLAVKGVKNQFITNGDFIKAQEEAEYLITFAEVMKDKKLVSDKVTTLDEIEAEVKKLLGNKETKYISDPVKPKQSMNEKLVQEALEFVNYTKDSNKISKINNFMQKFNVINEFETNGLFFEEGISKLNKIYTIAEITSAVEIYIKATE